MLRFLLFPTVLAVVAYATLGGAGFSDIIKFSAVLFLAIPRSSFTPSLSGLNAGPTVSGITD